MVSKQDLEAKIKSLSTKVLRAKGVIGEREFDLVQGSWRWGKYQKGKNFFNLICADPLSAEELVSLQGLVVSADNKTETLTNHLPNLPMTEQELQDFSRQEIAKLVDQYHQYMRRENQIKKLKEAMADLGMTQKIDLLNQLNQLQLEQKTLGEAMKYDNPLIWLEYKLQAYRGTENEIKTVEDLRKHSASPTYICHKRLTYLAKAMKENGFGDFWKEQEVAGEMELEVFLNSAQFKAVMSDQNVLEMWRKHEYFVHDGRVAKWENYQLDNHNASK